MKLESTLGDRSGMLYTSPLVDVVLLLIIFFLFGSNLVLKSGVDVSLPRSSSALPSAEDAHIITLIPGKTTELYFNDERIDLEQLDSKLDEAMARSKQVILLGDESISYGTVMNVSRFILKRGFELSFATQQETT
ncbi:MAG: biopolymer transporter ExbD [Verrucomicrobiales bacterium]|nr:biopolymer transporter ExbD [Verrucomicrobiales bacterium]